MERVSEQGPAVDIVGEIEEVLSGGRSKKETIASLLEELTLRFRALLHEKAIPTDMLEEWGRAIRESHLRLELYNISPASVVESLFYRMRLSAHYDRASAAGGRAQ